MVTLLALYEGNPNVTRRFSSQGANDAESVSMLALHHDFELYSPEVMSSIGNMCI